MVRMPEWTPGGDPMLALLPPELPMVFQALPREEQAWRGRTFLMSYLMMDNVVFSWAFALNNEPTHVAECKAIVAETRDEVIVKGLHDLGDLKQKEMAGG